MIKKLLAISGLLVSATVADAAPQPNTLWFDGSENVIVLRGEVGGPETQLVLGAVISAPANPILYVDTFGGSVMFGAELMQAIQARGDVTCVSPLAVSMGFAIMQSCKTRIAAGVIPVWMQHSVQMSGGKESDVLKIEKTLNEFIKPMHRLIVDIQATRIGMTSDQFIEITRNEWWLVGPKTILNAKAADSWTRVACKGPALTKKRKTIKVLPPEGIFGQPKVVEQEVLACPITDIPAN